MCEAIIKTKIMAKRLLTKKSVLMLLSLNWITNAANYLDMLNIVVINMTPYATFRLWWMAMSATRLVRQINGWWVCNPLHLGLDVSGTPVYMAVSILQRA